MNRKLLWRLCLSISLVGVVLVYQINELSIYIERRMSYIDSQYQEELRAYRNQAENLVATADNQALTRWLEQLQNDEQVFATVVSINATSLTSPVLPDAKLRPLIGAGRELKWPIHLHHDNPLMRVPFEHSSNLFLIELPQRMRPGKWWPATHLFLHLILPVLIFITLSLLIYRHLMRPLRELEQATRSFSAGDYSSRARPTLGDRDDELTRLADTFDRMAERTGNLIETQRQLLGDLSHELRTPLTRLELAIDCSAQEQQCQRGRMQREAVLMRQLVEDTLTIAWLQNEAPCLRKESVCLTTLVEAVIDDARFEFPDRRIESALRDDIVVSQSSERALWQAIENIVRNGLRHTPPGGRLGISIAETAEHFLLTIRDQGPGVPEHATKLIFKPFFRLDKSRDRENGGFGLGLALSERQIKAVGGEISAHNVAAGGLEVRIQLPR